MKKINNMLVAGTIISLVLPISSVLAETGTGTPRRVEKIEANIERQEVRLEQVKAHIASTTEARLQKADERAVKIANKNSEKLTERYTNAIQQLERTAQKISDRLNLLSSKGKNVASSTAALAVAQTKIVSAKAALATLQTKIDSKIITAKTRVAVMKDIRTSADTTLKTAIKDAHLALVNVINTLGKEVRGLKGIGEKEGDKTATTTSTTTNQ